MVYVSSTNDGALVDEPMSAVGRARTTVGTACLTVHVVVAVLRTCLMTAVVASVVAVKVEVTLTVSGVALDT